MKSTDSPSLIETVIASSAGASYVRTIPKEQTKAGSGAMSLALGWPPECATPVAAGGKYPQMADANGVLNLLSAAVQQLQARFLGPYNAAFATAIGGYPLNAIVSDTTAGKFWVSTAEDNTTVPGAFGAAWQDLFTGYVKKSGDTSTGTQYSPQFFSGGFGGGWNGARTHTGDYGWTNGLAFGNPANDGKYRGTWTVTDVLNEGGSNSSGLNLTGYDAGGKAYQWYFAWNGKITTPGGVLAFESDLSGYVANTNPGIRGALTSTSLCVNPSDGRSYLAYSGNTKIASLAWYSDVQTETQARVNAVTSEANAREAADTTLQNNINQKVAGLAAGKIMQDFVVPVIGSGVHDIKFPRAFSAPPSTIVISHGLTNGANSPVSVLSGWTATGFQIQTNGSTSVNFLAVGPA